MQELPGLAVRLGIVAIAVAIEVLFAVRWDD